MDRILVVEDDPEIYLLLREVASELCLEVVIASDEVAAMRAYRDNPNFRMIAFDGFLTRGDITGDTLSLIRSISRDIDPQVLLVAMSSDSLMRKLQINAGCNVELADKMHLVTLCCQTKL